ncbi:MAG: hypothetical protein BEN19_09075 [Epulopiscium sp. Nuni2H_MBin003]|nr:MAG: hypothetical protein BEN19_09075 [Epulopiscium sp. Nuni2H_MBin003]
MLPLTGLRILDLTTLSGYCGMEFADHGAEVIKIETPNGGDALRKFSSFKGEKSRHHQFRDRGKKSITLDIYNIEGQKLFKELVAKSDAVLENFPAGTLEKLGLGYEDMEKINPAIVYGRISALGSTGNAVNIPQSEIIAQAKTGAMHVTGFPEEEPTRIGFPIASRYSAGFLTSGVILAICLAKQSGEGQLVEVTLCGSLATITEDKVITYGVTDEDPMRTGNAHPLVNPYDIIKCKNGYVALGIGSDFQWIKLCKVLGKEDWSSDEKYCTNDVRGLHYFGDLRDKIEEFFQDYTMQELAEKCDSVLIPGTMCSTIKEALSEEQLHVRNMIVEVDGLKMSNRPVKFVGGTEPDFVKAPELGANNAEIFGLIDVDDAKLAKLRADGVI